MAKNFFLDIKSNLCVVLHTSHYLSLSYTHKRLISTHNNLQRNITNLIFLWFYSAFFQKDHSFLGIKNNLCVEMCVVVCRNVCITSGK